MRIEITADRLIQAFQMDWPKEYEITTLRILNAMQGERLARIEQTTTRGDKHPSVGGASTKHTHSDDHHHYDSDDISHNGDGPINAARIG